MPIIGLKAIEFWLAMPGCGANQTVLKEGLRFQYFGSSQSEL